MPSLELRVRLSTAWLEMRAEWEGAAAPRRKSSSVNQIKARKACQMLVYMRGGGEKKCFKRAKPATGETNV